MTPEQMRARAGEVNTQGTNLEDVIGALQSIIDGLQTEWEGAASVAYAQQFESLKPSFIKMKELTDQIAEQLNATAAATEQLDAEIASKFGI
jgi:WXG100 family type VII secretion target